MTDWPRLQRKGPRTNPGIVHFGPGAFFRAFNAVYTQDVIDTSPGDWGIVAVALRSPTAYNQLAPQGHAYTSIALGPDEPDYRVIESLSDVLVAPDAPARVLDAMSDPAIRIVSLTITEKGYCHDPVSRRLQLAHPDIVHDLANPEAPKSAPGFLIEALARRKAAGVRPFTVMSCDNLPSNGQVTQSVILDMAEQRDPALANWIRDHVAFPSTMVDRITPATTEADIAALATAQGYLDLACVQHEPFRQWVIEDNFVDGQRPDWSIGGAQFVADVTDHEAMKLRCLNGTHSALAYLGYLSGYETIAETVSDPVLAAYCKSLWKTEILPTVRQPDGEDLDRYCAALFDRYRNPSIRHRTWQIAMDGSQKLPQRLLGTLKDRLSSGQSVSGLAIAVAAWMRYVGGWDEKGAPIDVRDPLAKQLRAASDSATTPEEKVTALLAVSQVVEPALAENQTVRAALTTAYTSLVEHGARETCARSVG